MRFKSFVLPSLVLGGAVVLVGPTQSSYGFILLGHDLDLGQRDFRVFNNFTDATANDNLVPDSQFPGYQGAVMALWKGCVEWGSELHGTGGGDPWQPGGLGSGGANFDPAFAGEADGVGSTGSNIISEISGSDPGVFAFAESGFNGWRIRFWSIWDWSDGPTIAFGNLKDLQGICCHEYGHALGLDHSLDPLATMEMGTFTGNDLRDINGDDQNGVQTIYGAKSGSKPHISTASLSGLTVTITGTGFSATGNEVWFTNQLITADTGFHPTVIATDIDSPSGTSITLAIPGIAGKGDVLVKNAGTGHSALSNAFPFSHEGPGPTGPTISSISPSSIEAVTVGIDQLVTITGNNLTADTSISVDGALLFGIPSLFTFIDGNTMTFDAPLPSSLGPISVTVSNGFGSDTSTINYVANATPALQAGDGEEPVTFIGSTSVILGGTPGALFMLGFSLDDIPSVLPGFVSLEIGNGFSSLFQIGAPILIGSAGHTTISIPGAGLPFLTTFFLEGATIEPTPPLLPLPDSNKQELQYLF